MVKIRNMAILPPYPYCDVVSVDVNTIGYEQRGIVCSEMVATGAAVRLVTQNGFRCRKIRKQVIVIANGTNVWSVNINSDFNPIMHDFTLPPRCRRELPPFGYYATYMVIPYRRFRTTYRADLQGSRSPRLLDFLAMGQVGYPETSVRN